MAVTTHHIRFALMTRMGSLRAPVIVVYRSSPQHQSPILHQAIIPSDEPIPDRHHIAWTRHFGLPYRRRGQTRAAPYKMSAQPKRMSVRRPAHPIPVVAITIVAPAFGPIRGLVCRRTFPDPFRIRITLHRKRLPRKLPVLQQSHPCFSMSWINRQWIRAVFRDIPLQRDPQLPHVIDTLDSPPPGLGLGKPREQKRR